MTLSLYSYSVLFTDLDLWVSLDFSILEDCLIGSLGVLQRDQRLAGHVVLAHSHHLGYRDAHGEDLLLPAQEGDTFLHCYTLGYIIIRPLKNIDRYMSVSHPIGRPAAYSSAALPGAIRRSPWSIRRPPVNRPHPPMNRPRMKPSATLPWTIRTPSSEPSASHRPLHLHEPSAAPRNDRRPLGMDHPPPLPWTSGPPLLPLNRPPPCTAPFPFQVFFTSWTLKAALPSAM